MKQKNLKRGFTLMELLFVVAILSIVAAFAIPKFLDSREDAFVAVIKRDVSTISNAVQSHHIITGRVNRITDAVSVNAQNWIISDKKIEFKDQEKTCVTIELTNTHVNVTINAQNTQLCQKLYDSGVRSVSYELF